MLTFNHLEWNTFSNATLVRHLCKCLGFITLYVVFAAELKVISCEWMWMLCEQGIVQNGTSATAGELASRAMCCDTSWCSTQALTST